MLVGRHEERRRIGSVLAAARGGASAALVLRGEPGIGKTALLEDAASRADGMTVLRTRGIESESELAYSGLLELLRPLLAELDRLPERQAAALKRAFALEAAGADDSFAVCAGTLNLLAAAAEAKPLLALIDDAHWVDSASAEALAFTSRRLGSEGIVMLWAARDGEPGAISTEGVDELVLAGLETAAALELVTAAGEEQLAPVTARALVDRTGGNPLALLELPRMLTQAQRAGLEPLEQPLPASPALQRAFLRRLDGLPAAARAMLLIAAASDDSDLATILRAWNIAGLDVSRLEPSERARLVSVGNGRVEFRHPLVRAVVYGSADPGDRRNAHRVLAEALVEARELGRRAWHRALAAVEPDEAVAGELEATAARAQGNPHVAARTYERAARLTPEDGARARRLVAAAQAWERAGASQIAKELLGEAAGLTDDPHLLAAVEHLLGQILAADGEAKRASVLLEHAAARVLDSDAERAALMLADAVEPWVQAGDLDRAEEAAKRAWELGSPFGGVVELRVGLRYADVLGWRGTVERATELWLRVAELPADDDLGAHCAIGEALFSAGDDERARSALVATVETARLSSAVGPLCSALQFLSLVELRRGRLAASAEAATEAHELATAVGQAGERLAALGVLAWAEALLGREVAWRRHVEEAVQLHRRLGDEWYGDVSQGLLDLSRGRFEEAIGSFEQYAARVGSRVEGDAYAPRSFVPNLVEAYVRAGRQEDARSLLTTYEAVAKRSGRPSALAAALRCRALLVGNDTDFEAAVIEHERWDNGFERARTQLVYGEFLRRRKRRADARVQLRAALAAFEEAGAVIWAERAGTELRATGERARRRDPSTLDDLTPQELQVARLVVTGLTNREVAARLFLSPKTIETHLGRIYRKTGVRSRAELAHRFRDSPDSIAAPAS